MGAGWCAVGRRRPRDAGARSGPTGGIVNHTGVAGLALGGGVGWLMRKHGLTIDNLLSADVVTADGELLRASEDEHPDLFWALRGGGGNFGVVTSFEFRLHCVGPTVLAGPIVWDASDVGQVLRFYRDFVRDAPDELGTVVEIRHRATATGHPRGSALAPGVDDRHLLHAGPIEDGEQVLRALSRIPDSTPRSGRAHAVRGIPERDRLDRRPRLELLLEVHPPSPSSATT